MANRNASSGHKLPATMDRANGSASNGFVTPTQDKVPQVHSVPPKRILPIIFLPGIMGSNLRMSPERQAQIGKSNNIAWRPDNKSDAIASMNESPAERQRRLDPSQTVVDNYDPVRNPTGDRSETSGRRNAAVKVKVEYRGLDMTIDSPVLRDDVQGREGRRTKEQKACERGWGEVYFGSYRTVLETCEQHLNAAFYRGKIDSWWAEVINVHPAVWNAHPQESLAPLDEKTLRSAVMGCYFPVHAMGYNWLQSNRASGIHVANRIKDLIKDYQKRGFECEKVILLTHSMGGWLRGR